MTSFVNLMANDVWSEADIVNRTEALIHAEVSRQAEQILNRKVTAAAIGQYVLTPDEQAEVVRYAALCNAAREAGLSARNDMLLLASAMAVETASARMARTAEFPTVPVEDGTEAENPAYAADAAERDAASLVVSSASADVLALVALRKPVEAAVPVPINQPDQPPEGLPQ